jgi:hypothetical protein
MRSAINTREATNDCHRVITTLEDGIRPEKVIIITCKQYVIVFVVERIRHAYFEK